MDKRSLSAVLVLGLLVLMLTGCTPRTPEPKIVLGELPFEPIDIPSPAFDALNTGEFAQWYAANRQVDGVHSFTQGGNRYVLLSVGEKSTGGYALTDLVLTGTETQITVRAKLQIPPLGAVVTQALTYPHLLAVIPDDGRALVAGGVDGHGGLNELITDSGRYVGQIDSHSVEIKISGVPDEHAARAFRLSEAVLAGLDDLNLSDGFEVLFRYLPREGEQPLIIEMIRLDGVRG